MHPSLDASSPPDSGSVLELRGVIVHSTKSIQAQSCSKRDQGESYPGLVAVGLRAGGAAGGWSQGWGVGRTAGGQRAPGDVEPTRSRAAGGERPAAAFRQRPLAKTTRTPGWTATNLTRRIVGRWIVGCGRMVGGRWAHSQSTTRPGASAGLRNLANPTGYRVVGRGRPSLPAEVGATPRCVTANGRSANRQMEDRSRSCGQGPRSGLRA